MYTLELGRQVLEIPGQMLHHWLSSKPLSRYERHRFGPGKRQYLLFWMPPAGVPLRDSVVVYYHGGGWRVGRPEFFPTVAQFFLKQGFPVVMPAYRLTPWYSHQHMREDLNLALALTLKLMGQKGLQHKKILLTGMSAGATLAAHLAFNREELNRMGVDQDLFSGVLSVGGPLDLLQLPDFRAVRLYAGGRRGSPAFDSANPVNWLSGSEQIPVLLIYSRADAIVPAACSESFARHYTGPLEEKVLAGKTHLGSARFSTDDAETAAVIRNWLNER